jgi:hypothetical protein
VAAGKLNFQDMNQNNGKTVTSTSFLDWNVTIRQQPSGQNWENRGRSRSRRTDKGDDKGSKKDKGGDKSGKGNSQSKNSTKTRSDSDASTVKGEGKTNPKWDHSQRKNGDWVCRCGDYKYAWKEDCLCGGTIDQKLATWVHDENGTKPAEWDPVEFDENR